MKENEIKHECKNDILLVRNTKDYNGAECISVYLDCECKEDAYECVCSFEDNSLLTASQNYKAWLSQIAPYLIQNDFRIKDERSL